MKKFCIALTVIALLFTVGCDDPDDGKGSGNGGENPKITGITYPASGFGLPANNVTANSTIEIDYDQEITFTAATTNADTFSWTANPANIVTITNGSTTAATIKGIAVAGGNTEITFTASNGDKKATFKFKIDVAPRPSEGLYLDVYHNSFKVNENQEFPLKTTNTTGLTFTADAVEDDDPLDDSDIAWATADGDIVELSSATGASVTITPKKVGTANITVTVTSEQTGDAYDDKVVTFKVKVEEDLSKVLFMWSAEETAGQEPFAMTNGGSTPPFTHPGASQFMKQKQDMVVKSFRVFGSGTITQNDKGLPLGGSTNLRLALGQYSNVGTAAGTGGNPPAHSETTIPIPNYGGEIDLYRKKVRLTIDYADATVGSTQYVLRVNIGNNGTGESDSIFGAASNIWTGSIGEGVTGSRVDIASLGDNTADLGRIVLDIDTTKNDGQIGKGFFEHVNEAYLANTFISFHSQNNASTGITITGIKLEHIEGEFAPDFSTLSLDVKDGDDDAAAFELNDSVENTTKSLTATASNDAVITWSISDTGVATLSQTEGNSVTITAVSGGSATIIVAARKSGFHHAHKAFAVTVKGSGGPPSPPADWEWTYPGGLASGWTLSNATTAGSTITGSGSVVKKIRVHGNADPLAILSLQDTEGLQGILMNCSGANAVRFNIGTVYGTGTGNSTTNHATDGEFDFRAIFEKNIKIEVEYKLQNAAIITTGGKVLNLLINNNNNAEANNVHSVGTNWYLDQFTISNAATNASGTLSGIFDPSAAAKSGYNGDKSIEELLQTSFISISTSSASGNVLITRISVEYVDKE
jgi:hypothetical protein